jgi:hypothetical protein
MPVVGPGGRSCAHFRERQLNYKFKKEKKSCLVRCHSGQARISGARELGGGAIPRHQRFLITLSYSSINYSKFTTLDIIRLIVNLSRPWSRPPR